MRNLLPYLLCCLLLAPLDGRGQVEKVLIIDTLISPSGCFIYGGQAHTCFLNRAGKVVYDYYSDSLFQIDVQNGFPNVVVKISGDSTGTLYLPLDGQGNVLDSAGRVAVKGIFEILADTIRIKKWQVLAKANCLVKKVIWVGCYENAIDSGVDDKLLYEYADSSTEYSGAAQPESAMYIHINDRDYNVSLAFEYYKRTLGWGCGMVLANKKRLPRWMKRRKPSRSFARSTNITRQRLCGEVLLTD